MGKEIERKYLVANDSYVAMSSAKHDIAQGYLSLDPERVVRVRIADEKAYITVKSKNHGAVRGEWEYPIPHDDALQMLPLCKKLISKTRYIVHFDGYMWEVDVFHGRNQGLIVAEIEIPHEGASYNLPPFAGPEVTGDPRYYNSNLPSDGME